MPVFGDGVIVRERRGLGCYRGEVKGILYESKMK
jgi:hypothetical protein